MKIVLLPGLDGSGKLFVSFIAALHQDLSPVVCSYPDDPSMQYGELLNFASTFCPIDEPYLVLGESFSGPIAIELAAANPAMLRGVILVNTFATCPRPKLVRLLRTLPTRLLTNPPALTFKYLFRQREAGLEPDEDVASLLRSLSSHLIRSRLSILESIDVREMASKINVPVCLLQSADDVAVPKTVSNALVGFLRRPTIHHLKGNHFGLQSYPKEAAQIVVEFYRQTGADSRSVTKNEH